MAKQVEIVEEKKPDEFSGGMGAGALLAFAVVLSTLGLAKSCDIADKVRAHDVQLVEIEALKNDVSEEKERTRKAESKCREIAAKVKSATLEWGSAFECSSSIRYTTMSVEN